jgi:hypothetical protein
MQTDLEMRESIKLSGGTSKRYRSSWWLTGKYEREKGRTAKLPKLKYILNKNFHSWNEHQIGQCTINNLWVLIHGKRKETKEQK